MAPILAAFRSPCSPPCRRQEELENETEHMVGRDKSPDFGHSLTQGGASLLAS